jgi:hypothetical protein
MIVLSESTDKIQVVLGGSVTANQLQCMSSWRDVTTTTYVPGRTLVNTNNTTDVDIVGSPGASTQRVVDFLSVYNADTANATITIKLDANGTEYILWKGTIATGESVQYTDDSGFVSNDVYGRLKTSSTTNIAPPVINTLNMVVLSGDVVNNNGTANTIADVTGLSFAVTADQTYWFEFVIPYTSAATTTGSRWAINGPAAPTLLNMRSEYTLTATTTTVNSVTAYDTPSGANATSLTAGNVATMWGIIKPSQDGTVTARFASEVLSSAITAKAGATLRWIRII